VIAGFLLDGASARLIKEKGHLLPSVRDFYLSAETHALIESETPPLSPVCWVSFLTGKDPSEHNIFGFIERDFKKNTFYIPSFNDIRVPTLFDLFNELGLSFISVNIPGTYPPPLYKKGIIISDFLSPSMEHAVSHKWLLPHLRSMNYIIDIDPRGYAKDIGRAIRDIKEILSGRKELLKWINNMRFDIVLFHVMELDRICHYFYNEIFDERGAFFMPVISLLSEIDDLFNDFMQYFNRDNNKVFLLSDHGFQKTEGEFYPNTMLERLGLLSLAREKINEHSNDLPVLPPSECFCLYPGRVYLIDAESLGRKKDMSDIMHERLRHVFMDIEYKDKKVITDIISSKSIYSNSDNLKYDFYLKPGKGIDIKGFYQKDFIIKESLFQGVHDPMDGIFAFNRKIKTEDTIRIKSVKDMVFGFNNPDYGL